MQLALDHTWLACEQGPKNVPRGKYTPAQRLCLINPIEEFFAELKSFIKRNWQAFEDSPEQGFDAFLEWCVDVVGGKEGSSKGHFRHAGLTIEEL